MHRARTAIPSVLAGAAILGVAVASGCSGGPVLSSVPAPWEAAENPDAEPAPSAMIPDPARWERVGSSVRGKAIEARTVGSGPRRIYIIGGYYGDQPEAPAVAAALPGLLEGLAGGEGCTVRVLRDMNPDGSAARSKTNTRGIDLNRNWPAPDFRRDSKGAPRPGSEIETAAVQKDLLAFKPDLVVVLTSSVRGPVVAFNGGSRTLSYDFASAARAHDARFRAVPDRWAAGPGSVESYIVMSMRRPVRSVELARNADAAAARAVAAGVVAAGAAAPAGAPRAVNAAR
jgi:hypothetical protein